MGHPGLGVDRLQVHVPAEGTPGRRAAVEAVDSLYEYLCVHHPDAEWELTYDGRTLGVYCLLVVDRIISAAPGRSWSGDLFVDVNQADGTGTAHYAEADRHWDLAITAVIDSDRAALCRYWRCSRDADTPPLALLLNSMSDDDVALAVSLADAHVDATASRTVRATSSLPDAVPFGDLEPREALRQLRAVTELPEHQQHALLALAPRWDDTLADLLTTVAAAHA